MKFDIYEPKDLAWQIFKDRYAIHNEETFAQACQRVATHISNAEFGEKRDEYCQQFLDILMTNRFSPGGRIWRGSGRPRGQLLNCFCLPAEDSREGWGDALRSTTIISGTGGGVGLNFSKIRPRGTPIRGTGGEATGAVSLMKAINAVCNELREGGGRRSALLFCLNYDHPDLPEFMAAKLDKQELNNANISVCIDKDFLKALDNDEEIILRWQGEEKGRIKATEIWGKIIANAWHNGDPGLLNFGLANDMNTISYVTSLESTNPCGEVWLSAHGCCCLGAVNLATHVIDKKIEWDSLEETVALGVRFLDNTIDQNHYPLPIIEETCQKHRRIGLGVMGLHDMLLKLGLKYTSEKTKKTVEEVMTFIKKRAYDTSIELAIEKGAFHVLDREKHIKTGFARKSLTASLKRRIRQYGIRNCALLTIAPTGTTAIVAGTTSGIEPLFEKMYWRAFNVHAKMHDEEKEPVKELMVHPLVKEFILKNQSIKHFQSAHEISPEDHLIIQEICQRHVDNAISKTINLPKSFAQEQLSGVIRKYIENLKGVTIYRDGSRGSSPLTPATIKDVKKYLQSIKTVSSPSECLSGKCTS